jgi:hypothetical protein
MSIRPTNNKQAKDGALFFFFLLARGFEINGFCVSSSVG